MHELRVDLLTRPPAKTVKEAQHGSLRNAAELLDAICTRATPKNAQHAKHFQGDGRALASSRVRGRSQDVFILHTEPFFRPLYDRLEQREGDPKPASEKPGFFRVFVPKLDDIFCEHPDQRSDIHIMANAVDYSTQRKSHRPHSVDS